MAVEKNIVSKSGGWYSYGDKKLGNGKENVCEYLMNNREIREDIKKELFETREKN
jgi:recombination protein RecA